MARCTAPVRGHYSAQARADCPACGGGYGGYGGYSSYSPPRYAPTPPINRSGSGSSGGTSSRAGGRTARPSWSPRNSPVTYTPEQVANLRDVREAAVARTQTTDVFLCHAWGDRKETAKEFYEMLLDEDVSVWFSEVSLMPGTDMRAAIDKGLVGSRIGIVLVTPNMLERLRSDRSVAGSELSALLRRNLLVPVLHGVTFEELDQVSPTLASRGGFSTGEDSMEDIAIKVAELVNVLDGQEADELAAT